jgi:uncharacterized membrane protein YadS
MLVTVSGMIISRNNGQSLNALVPIETNAGKFITANLLRLCSEKLPVFAIFLPLIDLNTVKLLKLGLVKVPDTILVESSGKTRDVILFLPALVAPGLKTDIPKLSERSRSTNTSVVSKTVNKAFQ